MAAFREGLDPLPRLPPIGRNPPQQLPYFSCSAVHRRRRTRWALAVARRPRAAPLPPRPGPLLSSAAHAIGILPVRGRRAFGLGALRPPLYAPWRGRASPSLYTFPRISTLREALAIWDRCAGEGAVCAPRARASRLRRGVEPTAVPWPARRPKRSPCTSHLGLRGSRVHRRGLPPAGSACPGKEPLPALDGTYAAPSARQTRMAALTGSHLCRSIHHVGTQLHLGPQGHHGGRGPSGHWLGRRPCSHRRKCSATVRPP